MANTSRPNSKAWWAVISEPDDSAASTTKQPWPSAAIKRLRCGKCAGSGGVPSGYSLIRQPRSATSWASAWLPLG